MFSRKPFTSVALQVAQPNGRKGVQTMCSCPEKLQALEEFWHMKRGARAMPARSDFPPEQMRQWLGHIAIITVEPGATADDETRFRVALSGTKLDDYRGFGITGRYLDELAAGQTVQYYASCVEQRTPVRFLHDNSDNSAIYTHLSKLLLPLSEDGVTVDRILVALYPPANDAEAAACPNIDYALAS